jgi:hypothetical protein
VASKIPAALRGHRLVVVVVEGNGRTPPETIEIATLAMDGGNVAGRISHPIAAVVTRH